VVGVVIAKRGLTQSVRDRAAHCNFYVVERNSPERMVAAVYGTEDVVLDIAGRFRRRRQSRFQLSRVNSGS
jgi:hypothetical protein